MVMQNMPQLVPGSGEEQNHIKKHCVNGAGRTINQDKWLP
jgi:hypothetical protein